MNVCVWRGYVRTHSRIPEGTAHYSMAVKPCLSVATHWTEWKSRSGFSRKLVLNAYNLCHRGTFSSLLLMLRTNTRKEVPSEGTKKNDAVVRRAESEITRFCLIDNIWLLWCIVMRQHIARMPEFRQFYHAGSPSRNFPILRKCSHVHLEGGLVCISDHLGECQRKWMWQ